MAGEATVTIVGRLGSDPETAQVGSSGATVVNFSVATTSRIKDKQTQEWRDGETTWYECSAWREHAENIAATLKKGQQVIIIGRLKTRKYTKGDGSEGMALDVQVDEVGPAISRFASKARTQNWSNEGQAQAAWANAAAPAYDDEAPF
jgi:single-strand DNA-binding protein